MIKVAGTLAVVLPIMIILYALLLLITGLFWYCVLWIVSWVFGLTSIFGLTLWQAAGVMVLLGILIGGLKRRE